MLNLIRKKWKYWNTFITNFDFKSSLCQFYNIKYSLSNCSFGNMIARNFKRFISLFFISSKYFFSFLIKVFSTKYFTNRVRVRVRVRLRVIEVYQKNIISAHSEDLSPRSCIWWQELYLVYSFIHYSFQIIGHKFNNLFFKLRLEYLTKI